MKREQIHILIVEDETLARETLMEVLDDPSYSLSGVGSAEEALSLIATAPPDIVLLDIRLPGEMNGNELLPRIKAQLPATEVIMITGHAEVSTAIQAMKDGAYDYLEKPVDIHRLRALVMEAAKHRREEIERNALSRLLKRGESFYGIIGQSKAMQNVIERIKLVAPTDTTVLILGESGTGKELVADAIQALSKRKDKPFIKVNCSAIPEGLLESELFGHSRGAFTGAVKDFKGRFQQANGGTILLDEIGDMPKPLQSKLLRVIETGSVLPIGGNNPIQLDIRVVASTNRNLLKMVQMGEFREDLYFRLRVVTLELAPLREHPEDIPLLCAHFLRETSERLGKKIKGIAPEAMVTLERYPYQGNVRQLKNIIEEMALLSSDDVLSVVPDYIANVSSPNRGKYAGKSLSEIERAAIKETMRMTAGNKKKTAELLGIGLRTLYRKLDEYNLR